MMMFVDKEILTCIPFIPISYITNLIENAPEGTTLNFEGGLNMVEDLDKVRIKPFFIKIVIICK